MISEPAAHYRMEMNNPVTGLLDHLAGCMKSKESKMSVIQQSHALVLELSHQQFYAHGPEGDVGKGNENAATRRQHVLGFAENGLRLQKMLKHIAISDQVKPFTHGVAPTRSIQVQR